MSPVYCRAVISILNETLLLLVIQQFNDLKLRVRYVARARSEYCLRHGPSVLALRDRDSPFPSKLPHDLTSRSGAN